MLVAMHLPDHVLDVRVATLAFVASLLATAWCLLRAWNEQRLGSSRLALVPAVAAIVFAGQMVNYPLVGLDTSGHLIGAVLAAVILGPYLAVCTVALVLMVQALVFADGGITALGGNQLNMGLVAVFTGWGTYLVLGGRSASLSRKLIAVATASWLSTMAAALVCGLQLSISGIADWQAALQQFCIYHAWIGLGEAAITAGLVGLLASLSSVWVMPVVSADATTRPTFRHALSGLAVGLIVAAALAPWASSAADGLERVLTSVGLASESAVWTGALFPDYAFRWEIPGFANHASDAFATATIALMGTTLAFALGQLATWFFPASANRFTFTRSTKAV